jgi:hypothetical protein
MITVEWTTGHNIADLRRELACIPDITAGQARKMVADLKRATRLAERRSKAEPVTVRPVLPMLSALAMNGLR